VGRLYGRGIIVTGRFADPCAVQSSGS
jgi:hypothetical protein